jgi:hypothetical protein
MNIKRQRTFECRFDRSSGKTFADYDLTDCVFDNCALSLTLDPAKRSTVRNVRLTNCVAKNSTVYGAIIEGAVINGLRTTYLLQIWAAAYNRVILRGDIGSIMLSPLVMPGTATPDQQASFDEANRRYYESVEWALDIREARFVGFEVRGVPARLIRRDPETQIVVTRDKVLRGRWRDIEFEHDLWPFCLNAMIGDGDPEVVLVAGRRNKKFKALKADLEKLRNAGVSEPD